MAELGLFGLVFPEQYGEVGSGRSSNVLAVEEISRACASTGITLAAHVSLGTWPIYNFGTEEQKRKYLPALCSGERLGAFGFDRTRGGKRRGRHKTRGIVDGGGYVINGGRSTSRTARSAARRSSPR